MLGAKTVYITSVSSVNRHMNHMRYKVGSRPVRLVWAVAAMLAACAPTSPTVAATSGPPSPLHMIADIAVAPAGRGFAGRTPRMDYEGIDPRRRMLFVAYLGADEVVAIDIATNVVVGHITGLRSVHGVLVIPSLHRVYASATGTDEVATIDESDLKVVAR